MISKKTEKKEEQGRGEKDQGKGGKGEKVSRKGKARKKGKV